MFNKYIYKFEIRRNLKAALTWLAALGALSLLLMTAFPLVADLDLEGMLAQMGMDAVFGLSMSYSIGYFSTETLIMLQLSLAIYACMLAIKMLFGEEKDRTAEFLLTHPVSRNSVWMSKLIAMLTLLTAVVLGLFLINLFSVAVFAGQGATKNQAGDYLGFCMMFLFTWLMAVSFASVCYLLSAVFNRRSGTGISIGIALGMYIMALVYTLLVGAVNNDTIKGLLRIMQFATPFSFCDATLLGGYFGHQDLTSARELWLTLTGAWIWIGLSIAALYFSRKIYYKKDIC